MRDLPSSPVIDTDSKATSALVVIIPLVSMFFELIFISRIGDNFWNNLALGAATLACNAAFIILWVAILLRHRRQ